MYLYIISMDIESFNYVISSDDRTNTTANQVFYDIDFGGFADSPFDDYYVEVLQIILNGSVLDTNGYLIFTAEDLADNGRFCPTILHSNEAILGVIPTNIDGLMSTQPITFKTSNRRMLRRVRFRLLKPNFDYVVNGTDINVGGVETRWVAQFRLTPIQK